MAPPPVWAAAHKARGSLTSNVDHLLNTLHSVNSGQVSGHLPEKCLVVVGFSKPVPILPWRAENSKMPIVDTNVSQRLT